MKSLKQYITESIKTYDYTIKICGEVDKTWLDMFKYNLNKFDPIDISDPTTTPIQKDPYGFPGMSNQPITIIKANFRYPATEPMIQQIAQLLGYNVDMVRVVDSRYNDSINKEVQQYENQMADTPVLLNAEKTDKDAKAASKAYGDSYLKSIKDQSKDKKMEMPFDAKKTPNAFDPFKPYLGDQTFPDSPMSKITRPAKPKTGASA